MNIPDEKSSLCILDKCEANTAKISVLQNKLLPSMKLH